MTRFLITGHHGNIGSAFRRYMDRDAISYSLYGESGAVGDTLVHLAAKSVADSVDYNSYIDSNIVHLNEVIEYCRENDITKFVFASGARVYGDPDRESVAEENVFEHPNMYAISKLFGEMMLRHSGIRTLVVRLPGVLSPTSKSGVISTIYEKMIRGQDVVLTNTDRLFNHFLHVENLYDFVADVRLPTEFDMVNLAGIADLTLNEVAHIIKEETGSSSRIVHDHARRPFFSLDSTKARRIYGFTPYDSRDIITRWCRERREERENAHTAAPKVNELTHSPEMARDERAASLSYFFRDSPARVSPSMIREIVRECEQTGDTVRFCLHRAPDEDLHNMLIAHPRGAYVRPHANPSKSKAYHAVRGKMRVVGLDDAGETLFSSILGTDNTPIIRIPKGVFLVLIPLTEVCLFHEIAVGPFVRERDTRFAEWAPDGGDAEETLRFIQRYEKGAGHE